MFKVRFLTGFFLHRQAKYGDKIFSIVCFSEMTLSHILNKSFSRSRANAKYGDIFSRMTLSHIFNKGYIVASLYLVTTLCGKLKAKF